MIKRHHLIVGIIFFFCAQACSERAICPAYQSAFIHDKDVLERHFSYFGVDSMPKVMEASKDQFLIIEPVAYRKKLRSLATIPMRDVYPKEEDSIGFDDDFYLAERDIYDSSATAEVADSTYMISLKKEKFNIDQELYLWYLRDHLVYPDVRLQRQRQADQKKQEAREERRNRGIMGFFRNLFNKKNRSDSTVFDVETSATELGDTKKKEKKGIFGFLKGKDKEEQPPKEEELDAPPPTPADEDTGVDEF